MTVNIITYRADNRKARRQSPSKRNNAELRSILSVSFVAGGLLIVMLFVIATSPTERLPKRLGKLLRRFATPLGIRPGRR